LGTEPQLKAYRRKATFCRDNRLKLLSKRHKN